MCCGLEGHHQLYLTGTNTAMRARQDFLVQCGTAVAKKYPVYDIRTINFVKIVKSTVKTTTSIRDELVEIGFCAY